MRALPKVTCQHCGSTWFREVPLDQFATLESTEPTSVMGLSVLVCLCGTPARPNLGGLRGGRTPNVEISTFMNNFESTAAQMLTRETAESLLVEIQSGLMRSSQVQQVVAEVKAVERQIGRCLSWADGKKPGRHWGMPQRSAATRGRDQMVLALQQQGFTFRESRRLVRQFWQLMARLLGRGEVVDTPIGTFQSVRTPEPQVRWRFGRRQIVFSKRTRIRFQPRAI